MTKPRPSALVKTLLATFVFSWEGEERRSTRYGAIRLDPDSFDGVKTKRHSVLLPAIKLLAGQRVRLTAEVIEHRPSGHAGDSFLKIKPNPQPVGAVVDLGIGLLRDLGPTEDGSRQVALEPETMRASYWLDPRRLYELHDQTVRLYAEPTQDTAPTPFQSAESADEELIFNDDGVSFQVRTRHKEALVQTREVDIVTRDGSGLVEITSRPRQFKAGERVKLMDRKATVRAVAGALRDACFQAAETSEQS